METVIVAIVTTLITSAVTLLAAFFKFRLDLKNQAEEAAAAEEKRRVERLNDREARYDALEEKWSQRLAQQNNELLAALEINKQDCTAQITELETQLDLAEKRIDDYQLQVKEYQAKLNGHNAELEALRIRNRQYEAELAVLRTGLLMLIEQIRALGVEPVWIPPANIE